MEIRRVVIADDSSMARMFIRKCLEIAGLAEAEFVEVPDGEKALAACREKPTDLLVTDLNMPVLDGTEVLRRVSASPKLFGLPVLVISSLANETKEKELRALGAVAVLRKPINPVVVSEVIEAIVRGDEPLPGTGSGVWNTEEPT